MTTVEVFTIGGGEYIVNVFNAVAAWTGGGGYKSLIQVVFVMGLIYSIMVVAFNFDWRAWIYWFLQATAIYTCFMVPTVSVKVTDRVNPSLAPAVVANVPIGLGVLASFTSQIGDYLTRTSETVFVMPANLNYSSNGMIYGSRLMEATRNVSISDPIFAANLSEHMKLCVFYDVLLGFKSMDTLAKSPDLWAAIGPGSPARSMPYIVRSGPTTTSSSVVTCRQGYGALSLEWQTMLNQLSPLFGKRLYPRLSNAAAAAKLAADLPQTYQAFTGNASAALSILQQHLAITSFMQARDNFSGGTGSASIDSFAATRADIQTRNTYSAIAQGAMKWVPVLNIVLTVVFYAMFPVLFPLFLLPKTGVPTLRGYATGFFYLAAWGPLYVVLHMILMTRGINAGLATAPGGITLATWSGIGAVNDETATLAGYLISAVPFIAAGMARGAMAISSQATSYLQPSQNAAEAAALEASTGNYAYGNASIANATTNTRQRDQWNQAANFTSGTPQVTSRHGNGVQSQFNADGSVTTNQQSGVSQLEYKPGESQGTVAEYRKSASNFQSQAEQHRSSASQSFAAANTLGSQVFSTLQSAHGRDTVKGRQEQDAISSANNLTSSWSDTLVHDHGFTRDSADRLTRAAFTNGSINAGVAGTLGYDKKSVSSSGDDGSRKDSTLSLGASGTLGANRSGGTSQDRSKVFSRTDNERFNEGLAYLDSQTRSEAASHSRESFFRAAATSSDSEVKGLTQRRDASLTEGRSHSLEASQLEEKGKRYDEQASFAETHGYQSSRDLSQTWAAFVGRELAGNPALAASGFSVWQRDSDLTPVQRDARSALERRFQASRVDEIRNEAHAVQPLGQGTIPSPATGGAGGVAGWGRGQIGVVNAQGPSVNISSDERDPSTGQDVAGTLGAGDHRLSTLGDGARSQQGAASGQGTQLRGAVREAQDQSFLSTLPLIGAVTDWVTGGDSHARFNASPFARENGVGIKPGTNVRALDPHLAPAISSVAANARALGLTAPTITSGADRHHNVGSLHPDGKALDFRGNNLSVAEGRVLAGRVGRSLGRDYDVVFESSARNPDNNHLHAEYDPKR